MPWIDRTEKPKSKELWIVSLHAYLKLAFSLDIITVWRWLEIKECEFAAAHLAWCDRSGCPSFSFLVPVRGTLGRTWNQRVPEDKQVSGLVLELLGGARDYSCRVWNCVCPGPVFGSNVFLQEELFRMQILKGPEGLMCWEVNTFRAGSSANGQSKIHPRSKDWRFSAELSVLWLPPREPAG